MGRQVDFFQDKNFWQSKGTFENLTFLVFSKNMLLEN
jgi:hypothetical protein